MSMPSLSLEGKVAIVTGARRGIGRVIALTLAEAGADVAVCDIVVDGGEMEAVVEEIRKLGRRSLAVQTDISRKTDVDNMVQRVTDEFGAIDILVNDANFEIKAPLLKHSEEDWDKIIDTDLKGYFLCSQAVAKKMVERRKGSIINIAALSGTKGNPDLPVYSIAKAGIVMLTRLLAVEVGSSNIRVNAIAPGVVNVERLQRQLSDPERLKQIMAKIPLGRLTEPSDVANAVLFLASEASSYISGHTLAVDGGRMA